MDTLSELLDGPRATGAFLLKSIFSAPWSLQVRDQAPLTIVIILSGDVWLSTDDQAAVHLTAGDVAIARGPDPYILSDSPSTPASIFIEPGQRCVDASGASLEAEMMLGVRTWGNSADGRTSMITGTYQSVRAASERLLRSLPPVAVLHASEWDGRLVTILSEELGREDLGQTVFLDRLLDLMVIETIRAWFCADLDRAPAWHRSMSDPVVGPALRLIHDNVGAPWTLDRLAKQIGVSRAGLARRFNQAVGEPPMTYLTGLRLDMAADLLCNDNLTVAAVAHRVGYSSPFALSAAFKRVRGVSPREHKRRQAAVSSATVA